MRIHPEHISILWACTSSWYYGYHLSELNFPVASLTCSPSTTSYTNSRLPTCLGLNPTLYALVTAIFTIGGLIGSLASSWVVRREGLKGGLIWTGYLNFVGVLAMALAPHWISLALGRFVVGVASGIAICLVPPYLNLTAKTSPSLSAKSGQIGTLNQLAIVLGICFAQIAGLIATGEKGDLPGNWRYIVALSGVVAAAQIAASKRIVAPTAEDIHKDHSEDRDDVAERGDTSTAADRDEASPLLPSGVKGPAQQLSLSEILSDPTTRPPALLCAALMAVQQLSGVNAVMFYSTPVLRPLLPTSAGIVGIGVTVVNALMTLPAIFLMDRLGRKTLLLFSIAGMGATSLLLASGLNGHHQVLSAVSIVAFIAAFSIGLGPVPFLLIAELVPSLAIPAVSSLSLSINWISAFLIALLFLPIRNFFSSPSPDPRGKNERIGEGRVFYVFTFVLAVGGLLVWRRLKK